MKISRASDGFIMLETMLALVLIAGVVAYFGYEWREHQFYEKAEHAGAHITRIIQAVDAYVAQNADILADIQDSSVVNSLIADGTYPTWKSGVPRIGTDPNPCSSGPDPCVRVPLQKLVDAGFLGLIDSQTNNWGYGYDLLIKKTATGQGAQLDALLVSLGVLDRPERSGAGVPDFTAAGAALAKAGPNAGVVREVVGSDTTTLNGASLTVGSLAAFGQADKRNGNLGWVEKNSTWPNITMPGQLVARAGYKASAWASFLRLSGGKMTGDIDMGGNLVKNTKQVILGAACDGVDATSDASKKLAGSYATVKPQIAGTTALNGTPDMLGSGYQVTCGYDSSARNAAGTITGGYVWRKASAGVVSVEDAQAGMMDGMETDGDWVCWTAPWSGVGMPVYIKWVMWNGRVHAFAAIDQTATKWQNADLGGGNGYDLKTDYSHRNPSYNTQGWGYNWAIFAETGQNFKCRQGAYQDGFGGTSGTPGLLVMGDWAFGPNGIKFMANGSYTVSADASATGTLGGVPVQGTLSGSVGGANCNYAADGTLMGCSPNGGPVSLTAAGNSLQTVSQADDAKTRITTTYAIKQSSMWSFQKQSRLAPGPGGSLSACMFAGQTCEDY